MDGPYDATSALFGLAAPIAPTVGFSAATSNVQAAFEMSPRREKRSFEDLTRLAPSGTSSIGGSTKRATLRRIFLPNAATAVMQAAVKGVTEAAMGSSTFMEDDAMTTANDDASPRGVQTFRNSSEDAFCAKQPLEGATVASMENDGEHPIGFPTSVARSGENEEKVPYFVNTGVYHYALVLD